METKSILGFSFKKPPMNLYCDVVSVFYKTLGGEMHLCSLGCLNVDVSVDLLHWHDVGKCTNSQTCTYSAHTCCTSARVLQCLSFAAGSLCRLARCNDTGSTLATEGPLRATWKPLGATWVPLGGLVESLGATWVPLGGLVGPLGTTWLHLGRLLGRLGHLWGRPEGTPCEKCVSACTCATSKEH